ncbi:MAG: hypothetical protein GOV15_02070 [Candidatus Diapherotrites archaeon]|nr:hypothetical protein [Candidatus Diapherotrites archaeon]
MERKALSPVIAAILMIIVVVALVIILYGFSVGMLGGTTTVATEAGTGMTGSTSTGLIESVDTDANIIYVRTTNDVSTAIDAIYVDGAKTACSPAIAVTGGSLEDLNATECAGLTVSSNQTIVVTGTNNFRATGKS